VSENQAGPGPLLSLRAAVVFLIGVITAVGAAALTHLAGQPPAAAVLAAGATFMSSVAFSHSIIG
jgi:hypothetical protein